MNGDAGTEDEEDAVDAVEAPSAAGGFAVEDAGPCGAQVAGQSDRRFPR